MATQLGWTHMDAVDSTSWLGLLPKPQRACLDIWKAVHFLPRIRICENTVQIWNKYGTFWENSLKKIRIPIDTSVVSQQVWHPGHFPRVLQSVVVTKEWMVRIHGLCSFHNPYKPDYSLGQHPTYHIFPPTIYTSLTCDFPSLMSQTNACSSWWFQMVSSHFTLSQSHVHP